MNLKSACLKKLLFDSTPLLSKFGWLMLRSILMLASFRSWTLVGKLLSKTFIRASDRSMDTINRFL